MLVKTMLLSQLLLRGSETGLCETCGERETGHHCPRCKKYCCNLCNKVEDVEDLTDILCHNCVDSESTRDGSHERVTEDDRTSNADQQEEELSNYNYSKRIMTDLVEELPECSKINYDVEALTRSYINFTRLRKMKNGVSLEKVYEEFHRLYSQDEENVQFISFFEKIEIKSFSEAIAEGIGSIMKIATGKGRNLEPLNFSKEIFLTFNLPPLHILKKKFIPEIAAELSRKKLFFRKCANTFPSYQAKLKFTDLSASLGNYRAREETNCRLPVELFDVDT